MYVWGGGWKYIYNGQRQMLNNSCLKLARIVNIELKHNIKKVIYSFKRRQLKKLDKYLVSEVVYST